MGLSGATYRSKQQHIYTDLADNDAANLVAVQKQEVMRVFPYMYACVVINTVKLMWASNPVHKRESVNLTHSVTQQSG